MKTRQGKCINSEKCPLSREEEIFTIEGDSPFECPLCGTGLTEFVAEDPAPVVPEGTAEREVAAEAEIDTAEGEASPPEPHTTEEWHQAQESVELPLRVEAYPETPEVLPTATEWVEHAEVNTPWVAESVPEADTQPEQRPEAEAKAAEVWWEKTEAATNRGDKSREKPLQIIAPIDRGLWGEDTSEVEDAPEVVAPAAPRMTEKAPPIILVVAVLVVLLVGAGFYAVTHKLIVLPGLLLDAKGSQTTIMQISGSNLMGDSLMPAMAAAYLKYRGATGVHTVAGEHPGERIVLGTLPGDVTPSAIVIASRGTASAFSCLGDHSCDIGMAARRISVEEASRLAQVAGDMYSPLQERVVGLDGIAVIVNLANPMNSLPEDQVRQFFTGETTNMATASSPIGPVAIYARDEKSATWEMFNATVLGGRPLASGARQFDTGSALSDAVAGDPYGIGFVEFPFIRGAKPIAVSDKSAIQLLPTRLTVATEDYPLSRRLYLYTAGNSSNMYARQFADFAMSQSGQEVVRATGFVCQNVEPMTSPVPISAPEEYRRLTANARRLSVDFRFLPDSTQLDNKGLADLDRVNAAISELRLSEAQVMLFGFSDDVGSRESEQAFSLELAKTVQNQLTQKGLTPATVNGYGPVLPLASSDTAEGRRRNRRVEVWVKE